MSETDWDNDGIPNAIDKTPGEPPGGKPLEMPETPSVPKNQEQRRPNLSLMDDYSSEEETGAASVDTTKPGAGSLGQSLVQVGTTSSSYSGGIPTRSPNLMPFDEAQKVLNSLRAKARMGDEEPYNNFVNALRLYTKQALGTEDAVNTAWRLVLTDAQTESVDAFELLYSPLTGDGEGDGTLRGIKSGSGTGPRTTVSMASERDLRITADTVASTVLGRAVTDEEFNKVLKKVREVERAEPTVTTTAGGMTTTQSGLTAEGRQNIITEALMQGPEAEDFGKATKMMDLFYSALEARPSGA